jgi:hypothetical protein
LLKFFLWLCFPKAFVKVLSAGFLSAPLWTLFSLQQFPCNSFAFSNSFPFQKLPTPKSPKQKNQAKAKAPQSSPNQKPKAKSKKP